MEIEMLIINTIKRLLLRPAPPTSKEAPSLESLTEELYWNFNNELWLYLKSVSQKEHTKNDPTHFIRLAQSCTESQGQQIMKRRISLKQRENIPNKISGS